MTPFYLISVGVVLWIAVLWVLWKVFGRMLIEEAISQRKQTEKLLEPYDQLKRESEWRR